MTHKTPSRLFNQQYFPVHIYYWGGEVNLANQEKEQSRTPPPNERKTLMWDLFIIWYVYAMYPFYLWRWATLFLHYHYYHVLVAEATTAVVDDKGRTWQLLSNSYCYFLLYLLFACCCFLHYCRVVVLTELSRQLLSRCWFHVLLCVFLWMYRLISVVILVERGQVRNEHGVIVAGISLWVWCLVSACSLS